MFILQIQKLSFCHLFYTEFLSYIIRFHLQTIIYFHIFQIFVKSVADIQLNHHFQDFNFTYHGFRFSCI
jgi:hypothetical protein